MKLGHTERPGVAKQHVIWAMATAGFAAEPEKVTFARMPRQPALNGITLGFFSQGWLPRWGMMQQQQQQQVRGRTRHFLV